MENKIEGCIITEKEILIKPKDSPIRVIIIFRNNSSNEYMINGYINLLDFTDIWTKIINDSFKNDDFNLSETYLDLIGFEVTLKEKGLIRREPFFDNKPRLSKLRKITSLQIKNKLMNILNNNSELFNKIRSVKPKKIDIELIENFVQTEIYDYSRNFLDNIKNISDIIWGINIIVNFDQSINAYKACNIIDIMNIIAKHIVEMTRYQIMKL
ncbi:MAG: hypothetical protein HWN66_11780 [Candidatus Helarchaeota archaeon]|nr:hypothetical protein [Candidatus Helarchaeota archaeon]